MSNEQKVQLMIEKALNAPEKNYNSLWAWEKTGIVKKLQACTLYGNATKAQIIDSLKDVNPVCVKTSRGWHLLGGVPDALGTSLIDKIFPS